MGYTSYSTVLKINEVQKEQLKAVYLKNITFDKISFAGLEKTNLLLMVQRQKDGKLLEYILVYYYYAGFKESHCSNLLKILLEDWHNQHEEIARIMQFKLNCPGSIAPLSQAIENRYGYLFEQDDYYYPFVRQCLYAIASLRSEEAKSELMKFVNNVDPEIRVLAQTQLNHFTLGA